jgi:tRNA A37 threonylcarbamoyladenosine dehydratase
MNSDSQTIFHRVELVLGEKVLKKIYECKVIIFGLGGVGSWTAESLVRTGFRKVTLVDNDTICLTNVNRQLQATSKNVGEGKAEALKKRLLEINPNCEITISTDPYHYGTVEKYKLEEYDYVVDSIDSLKDKVLLIEECLKRQVKVFSSMGAAAKTDPTKIKADWISKSRICTLAKWVRKRLRKKKAYGEFMCVYSEESALKPQSETPCGTSDCACHKDKEDVEWCSTKAQINGSLAHITAIFGFMLAGLIVKDVASKESV